MSTKELKVGDVVRNAHGEERIIVRFAPRTLYPDAHNFDIQGKCKRCGELAALEQLKASGDKVDKSAARHSLQLEQARAAEVLAVEQGPGIQGTGETNRTLAIKARWSPDELKYVPRYCTKHQTDHGCICPPKVKDDA